MKLLLIGLMFVGASLARASTLVIGTWENYDLNEIANAFEKKTKHKVIYKTYSTNEELLAKLRAGIGDFDVLYPSDYMVQTLAAEKLIEKLPQDSLDRDLRSDLLPYISQDQLLFAKPIAWGTTGIAYRGDLYPQGIHSWSELFTSKNLVGRFSLLDDPRETLGAALLLKSKSLNATDEDSLKTAADFIVSAARNAKTFTNNPESALLAGELWAAQMYSADAYKAAKASSGRTAVRYAIPKEGASLWVDYISINRKSRRKDLAQEWMNWVLLPENLIKFHRSGGSSTVSTRALKSLPTTDPDYLQIKGPELKGLRFQQMTDIGSEANVLWDRSWRRVKLMSGK
jgi:spermidine/putrescine transport system substrate-binding protein